MWELKAYASSASESGFFIISVKSREKALSLLTIPGVVHSDFYLYLGRWRSLENDQNIGSDTICQ